MLKIFILGVSLLLTVESTCTKKSSPKEHQDEHGGEYIIIDDMYIKKNLNRAGLQNNAWPNGIIPYSFDSTLTSWQVGMINESFSDISAATCIQFRPARRNDTYSLLYKNDKRDNACSSLVGWNNSINQPIQLSNGCSKGSAVHETIHALGFYHEHTREDRDDYVKINCDNIEPGTEINFKKMSEINNSTKTDYFGVRYNYESIMHYSLNSFSRNQKAKTIEILNNHPQAIGDASQVGQRDHLSQGDIDMINAKYKCPQMDDIKTTTKNPMCQTVPNAAICIS